MAGLKDLAAGWNTIRTVRQEGIDGGRVSWDIGQLRKSAMDLKLMRGQKRKCIPSDSPPLFSLIESATTSITAEKKRKRRKLGFSARSTKVVLQAQNGLHPLRISPPLERTVPRRRPLQRQSRRLSASSRETTSSFPIIQDTALPLLDLSQETFNENRFYQTKTYKAHDLTTLPPFGVRDVTFDQTGQSRDFLLATRAIPVPDLPTSQVILEEFLIEDAMFQKLAGQIMAPSREDLDNQSALKLYQEFSGNPFLGTFADLLDILFERHPKHPYQTLHSFQRWFFGSIMDEFKRAGSLACWKETEDICIQHLVAS